MAYLLLIDFLYNKGRGGKMPGSSEGDGTEEDPAEQAHARVAPARFRQKRRHGDQSKIV
jgi:hypothetical protein